MAAASTNVDVFVLGGGPAGLATAIAAAQQGLGVALTDCARPPIDKACGEGIMPDGVAALHALGVALPASSAPIRGIAFFDASREVRAGFADGRGCDVRRTTLHTALAARARFCGADLNWGARLEHVDTHSAVAGGRSYRFRYLIGADGRNSRVRAIAGLEGGRTFSRRFGFRRHYSVRRWSDEVEVYWSDYGEMYVSPTTESEICVALLTRDPHVGFETALSWFPALHARLRDAMPATRIMGGVHITRELDAVYSGNVTLVGDASGSVDAVTGDGLSLAFRQASVLAEALRSSDLAGYQQAHREIMRLPLAMARLLLMLEHRQVRRRVFRVFARKPEYFAQLLAIYTRARLPSSFGIGDAVSMGWELLTA